MPRRRKKARRVDEIRKPRPFIRFRLRVVVFFFVLCLALCLAYYMVRANADPDVIVTGAALFLR